MATTIVLQKALDCALSAAAVLLLAYVLITINGKPPAPPGQLTGPKVGDTLPLVFLEDGADFIAIISPRCPFCERSVTEWNKLADSGYKVVAFSAEDPTQFVEATAPSFPVRFLEGSDATAFSELGVTVVPLTMTSHNGAIASLHMGLVRDAGSQLATTIQGGATTTTGREERKSKR